MIIIVVKYIRKISISFFLLSLFFIVVVIFPVIYYCLWSRHSDSFIVHQETNLHPIQLLQDLLWGDSHNATNNYESFTLKDFSRETMRVYLVEVSLSNEYRRLKREESETSDLLSKASKDHMKAAFKNYEIKVEEETKSLREKRVEILNKIKLLQDIIDEKRNSDKLYISQIEVQKAMLRVEETKINVEISKMKLKISESFIKNITAYADSEKLQKVHDLDNKFMKILNAQSDNRGAYFKNREAIHYLLHSWQNQRSSQLSYWDFLYFSFCVSTTTSFGDVIPNDKISRIFVSIQIFMELFILGVLIDRFARRINKEKNLTVEKQ